MSLFVSQPAAYLVLSFPGQGTLVSGTAWILPRFLPDRSVSLRHAVWMLAFPSLLILPVTEGLVPEVGILPETPRSVVEQGGGLIFDGRPITSVPMAAER